MAIDRNNNPMLADFASTSITSSVFFSTPCMVERIVWTSLASSNSIHLTDMDGDELFGGVFEAATAVVEDPIVLANGLRFSTSVGQGAIGTGKLFVWVR